MKEIMNNMNRETWLNQLAGLMSDRFAELGKPIPRFRVAVAWTSAGKSAKYGGECWHSSNSADGVFEIMIAPIADEPMRIAAVLAHELAHAAAGFKHGHKGDFAELMKSLGMLRPFTSSIPGPTFEAWVQPFLEKLGPLPHARIMLRPEKSPAGEDAEDDGDGEEGGSSNYKKKQSTRMLKATCQAINPQDGSGDTEPGQPCGYTVRLSKKWALKYGACCPVHGSMEVEGADDQGGDEDADE